MKKYGRGSKKRQGDIKEGRRRSKEGRNSGRGKVMAGDA